MNAGHAHPVIELLFFTDRRELENLLGLQISERDSIRSEFEPNEVLRELLERSTFAAKPRSELIACLTDRHVEAMRRQDDIRSLCCFLDNVQAAVPNGLPV